jgi:hypothetical protein
VDPLEKWGAGAEAVQSLGGDLDRHDAGTGRTHPVDVLLPSGLGADRGRRARSGYANDVDLQLTIEKDAQAWAVVRVPGNDGVGREGGVDDPQPVDVDRLMPPAAGRGREDLGAAGSRRPSLGRAVFRGTERCAHLTRLAGGIMSRLAWARF